MSLDQVEGNESRKIPIMAPIGNDDEVSDKIAVVLEGTAVEATGEWVTTGGDAMVMAEMTPYIEALLKTREGSKLDLATDETESKSFVLKALVADESMIRTVTLVEGVRRRLDDDIAATCTNTLLDDDK